tara:strand:- start:2190 stop:2621 length:432 start_codon:yes stop_codon:yes gene_type:complete
MVTATLGKNDPEVGTRVAEGNDEYILVYNNGTTQISVGQGAVVTAVSGYSVTVSSIVGVDMPIGVCKHATLTTATYGYLLTRGFSSAKAATSTAPVAGDVLMLGTDGVWTVKSLSTGFMGNVNAKAMTATASAGVCQAFFSIY